MRIERPNPDVWITSTTAHATEYERGEVRLEVWHRDDRAIWVFVVEDGSEMEHAAVTDAMAAMLLKVMGMDDENAVRTGNRGDDDE